MSDIWVSSDQHLYHDNILKFKDRDTDLRIRPQFDNVTQMNDHILEMHNSVVKPGDIYYCLGDIMMGVHEDFKKLWPKFNGKKRLIVGNHDDIKFLASGGFFSKIQESRSFNEFGLLFTHRPAHESQMWDYKKDLPMNNLHGHIHQNKSPSPRHINMSMEAIAYTPQNIDTLRIR